MTATEAVAAFKAGTLSPVALMEATLARIDAVNPVLNAFTEIHSKRAFDQARAAEDAYRRGSARPLEGIPVAIKDFHPVAGELTTFGSKAFADNRPTHTAPTVARLLDAGAIMHARTTTPEFAYAPITASPLWGVTRNPWSLDHAPGGSSGGAGAALAAGMTMLADGTDAGGSVRIPAAACHVVGYKPPFGRNPLDRDHPIESLLHYGPMARSVGDAALMQNVMSGAHGDDMCSLREGVELPASYPPIAGWTIGFSMDLGMFEIDPEVARNTHAAVEVFRRLGCTIREVQPDWSGFDLPHPYLRYWEGMAAASLGGMLDEWRDEMDPYMVRIIENGRAHSAETLSPLQHRARRDVPLARPDPRGLQRAGLPVARRADGRRRARLRRGGFSRQRQAGSRLSGLEPLLPLQHGKPVPGDRGAERPDRRRPAHRDSDRRADLRRSERLPGRGGL